MAGEWQVNDSSGEESEPAGCIATERRDPGFVLNHVLKSPYFSDESVFCSVLLQIDPKLIRASDVLLTASVESYFVLFFREA